MTLPRREVLLLGTQRSGTTLTRLLLGALPGTLSPLPLHALRRLGPLEPALRRAHGEEAPRHLAEILAEMVRLSPLSWEHCPQPEAILEESRAPSLPELLRATYEAATSASGASRWVLKVTGELTGLDTLIEGCRSPLLVHLLRDPRDVTASFQDIPFGEKHPYVVAKAWKKEQQAIATLLAHARAPAVRIAYEDLVQDPPRALAPLCRALGLHEGAATVQIHGTDVANRAASSSAMWQNVDRPIFATSVGSHASRLLPEDIEIVERILGPVLELYGYSPTTQDLTGSSFAPEEVAGFLRENEQRKLDAFATRDPVTDALHAPQQQFVRSLYERYGVAADGRDPVTRAP